MVADIHSLRTRRTEFHCTRSRRAKVEVPPSVHLRADVPGPYGSPRTRSSPLPLAPGHLLDKLHFLGPVGFSVEVEDVVEPHGRLAVGVRFLPGIPRQVGLCLTRNKAPIVCRHLVLPCGPDLRGPRIGVKLRLVDQFLVGFVTAVGASGPCGVTEDLGAPRWLRNGDVNGVIRGARPPWRFRCLCHRNFCHRHFGGAVGYNTRRETRWDVDQARRARAMIALTMKEVCRTWRS